MNEQLSAYIRQQLAAGVSKDRIATAVAAVGWNPVDVQDTFAAIETVQTSHPASSLKRLVPLLGIVGGIVLVASGVTAYAYVQNIGPFRVVQYTEDSFLSSVLSKVSDIHSASYVFSVSLSVDPRDNGAVAFVVPALDVKREEQYTNDVRRVSDVSSLLDALQSEYGENKIYDYKTKQYVLKDKGAYPASLSATVLEAIDSASDGVDPITTRPYQYVATENGKNFALVVTFETDAAISAIRNSYRYTATTTLISGKRATFTKDSSSYFYLPSKPPEPLLATFADTLRSISADVSAKIAVGATTDFSTEGFPDWRFTAAADGSFGDLSYKVDVEALKKDTEYYVRINKMPALPFISLSNYKGQWIAITPSVASSSRANSGVYDEFSSIAASIAEAETEYKKSRKDLADALKNIVLLADAEKLIEFKTRPIREKVEGRSLYRYQLDIRKESIIPFYTKMLTEVEKYKDVGLTQDQGLLEYLRSSEFDTIFSYVKRNTFLTLWTDDAGFPALLEYRVRVVPPDTAVQLKDKQINLVFKLTYTDINEPVKIDVPKDAKPIDTIIEEIQNNMSDPFSE